MTRYLLGELSGRELDELEERYFGDDELFGELLDAQDQIVDDYLCGQLSQRERERFERYFLTLPGRRREVELAALLDQNLVERCADGLPTASAEPAPRNQFLARPSFFDRLRASRPIPVWTLVAAALIVTLSATWTALKTSRLQDQLSQSQARQAQELEQARNERASLKEELARLKTSAVPEAMTLSLDLLPGASRSSGEIKEVKPGSATQMIECSLAAGAEDYVSYQAILQPADDESVEIMIYKRLEAKTTRAGKNVVIRIPAAMLEIGDYQIRLDGIGPEGGAPHIIGKYLFQVRP